MTVPAELEKRLKEYRDSRDLILDSCLGAGTQGSVFLFKNPSRSRLVAVKFHNWDVAYNREVAVYLRLRDLGINEVSGHWIPDLIDYDDELLAIEMTVVSPPFCLDFGGAYLDQPPDYSPEVWADWHEQKSEAFEENWPAVQQILGTFESFGVYIADVNPGNIRF